MATKNSEVMIGLAEAAQRLALPYQDAHRLLPTQKLRGKKRGGRWWVSRVDVERLERERVDSTDGGTTG